jgi:membrane dipeptidase
LSARAISEEHAVLVTKMGGIVGAWPSAFNASFDEFVISTKRLVDVIGTSDSDALCHGRRVVNCGEIS